MGLQILGERDRTQNRFRGNRSKPTIREVIDQSQGRNKLAIFRKMTFESRMKSAAPKPLFQVWAPFGEVALCILIKPDERNFLELVAFGADSIRCKLGKPTEYIPCRLPPKAVRITIDLVPLGALVRPYKQTEACQAGLNRGG